MTKNFDLPPNTGVLVCSRVFQGGPILRVSHDDNGQWQFLCDADHSVEGACPPKLCSLAEVLRLDPGLVELSDLCISWSASRSDPAGEWIRHDDMEVSIRKNVREFGWHACMVQAAQGRPNFVYSIGLFRTYRKPEIILFGLPPKVAHTMIWTAADLYKEGSDVRVREPMGDFLEGYPVLFREVHASTYREYFGYGLWFYDGPAFPALQCFWPDKKGRFPWEEKTEAEFRALQPDLSQPLP
jgi:hypothetical protein